MQHGNRFIDRTGQRYGSIVVKEHHGSHPKNQEALWLCICDCGKEVVKTGNNLTKVKTCGNTCTAMWDKTIPEHEGQGEPIGIVYKLTNKVDGKIYIGQTLFTLEDRWRRHVEYANRGGEGYLQKAIRTYGPESFTKEVITVAYNKQQLDELEKYYICSLNTLDPEIGYNQTWRPGIGDNARQTLSEKNLGNLNPAYREDLLDQELIELYKSGLSLAEIARQYGTNHKTLSLRFKRLGVEIKIQPNQKDIPDEEIIAAYNNGTNATELATKYGVSRWVITNRLQKAGITLKTVTPSNGLKREDVPTELLAAQFNTGIKIADLARIHKMDRKTIRTRLDQVGIETNTRKKKVNNNSHLPPDCRRTTSQADSQSTPLVG